MGLFGICDIINSLEKREKRDILKSKLTGFWLSRQDIKACAPGGGARDPVAVRCSGSCRAAVRSSPPSPPT